MDGLNDLGLQAHTELLPNLIDHYAKFTPDAVFAAYPINPMSYSEGYRSVTYKAFANAINGVAHWLIESLGSGKGEILAYMGPNDVRYPALVLGAIKTNYCMFFPSPRNSVVAHKTLLSKLECKMLLAPVPWPPFIGAIQEAASLKTLEIPNLETLLTSDYAHFTYSKTYPENATDGFIVLHTSGSTGIPKPILWTHETTVRRRNMQQLAPPEDSEGEDRKLFGKRVYLTLPPSHAAGLGYNLFILPPVRSTAIMPIAAGLPTAEGLVASRKQVEFDSAVVVPSIVSELAGSSEALDYCSTHLEQIMYAGGDLPEKIGNTVAAKIPLMNAYGATEIGMLSVIHSPERDPLTDWRYLHFHPELGMELRHVSGNEYEAVLPGLWRPYARRDDVIVFINGEKTNPISMEQHIVSTNPEVTGCIVIGAQRFQAAVIIELGNKELSNKELSADDRAAMIEIIWPSIDKANLETPAHARITKSHILFTRPGRPLPRASKGTVQRAIAIKDYEKEIESLYEDSEKLLQLDSSRLAGPGELQDTAQVAEYIRASILDITGWDSETFADDTNWLDLGMDSLQAITLTRVLRNELKLPTLAPNVIYLNSTVSELTSGLQSLHKSREGNLEAKNEAMMKERDQLPQELIESINHTAARSSPKPLPACQSVVLTGSTGQLGTYILDSLLKSSQVKHIYCLDRDPLTHARQRDRRAFYRLEPLDEIRITFWKADLSQANLGLQDSQIQEIRKSATLLIHNAWAVNFNLPLASFKPHLMGVVNLMNFCMQATYYPRMFFISSISSIIGHATASGLTPEESIITTCPAPNGYATSKYLAERLLGHAAQQGALCPSFARVGQVAGSIRSPGLWSKSEWFPSVALSSLLLGALPDTLGPAMDFVDWVPTDLLAEVLVDLALIKSSRLTVYHPVNLNPRAWSDPRAWSEILPIVADSVQSITGKSLDIIPMREWVTRVRKDIELVSYGESSFGERELQTHLAKNPAARLLGFFEDGVSQTKPHDVLDTQNTARVSEKLRQVDPVKSEWIQKWLHEWLQ